jgi:hypothetical protein
MKWIAISGSWRLTNSEVEKDVRKEVSKIIKSGDGIVSGGALNVDYFATDEAMKHNPSFKQIKIFLPSTLPLYAKHYRMRAGEGAISDAQADQLIEQLSVLKSINAESIIENLENTDIDKKAYFDRNMDVVKAADELLAFQVNKSEGVQDTINKAIALKIPVRLFEYNI